MKNDPDCFSRHSPVTVSQQTLGVSERLLSLHTLISAITRHIELYCCQDGRLPDSAACFLFPVWAEEAFPLAARDPSRTEAHLITSNILHIRSFTCKSNTYNEQPAI